MHRSKIKALNNLGRGKTAMTMAKSSELGMTTQQAKVAGSSGIGSAVEYVQRTKAQRKAARQRQKAARRVNR